jgi:hypothetical protein
VLRALLRVGFSRLKEATLIGQYSDSQGIQYGGASLQEETTVVMGLFREHLPGYREVLALDMHSGYGKRGSMSLVNSSAEPRACSELAERFGYDQVVASDSPEFYGMHGDIFDWLYGFMARELPETSFYAACFEFGTLGDSPRGSLRSLRAVILENQMYWYGAKSARTRKQVTQSYEALFTPPQETWRAEALRGARRALTGILKAEGFISASSG